MKKFIFVILAIVAMVATSCQQPDDLAVNGGEVATVTVNVGASQMSRAFSDGTLATNLQYAVYSNGTELEGLRKTDATISTSGTNVKLELATNKTYTIVFWAAAEGAPYTLNFGNHTVEVDYNGAECNDEARDAFYACIKDLTVTGPQTLTATLRRPFAQINVGTNDIEAAKKAGLVPSTSEVVVNGVCNTLDLVSGEANGLVDASFDAKAIPVGEEFPVTGYGYLAISYVLVGNSESTHDVTFTIKAEDNTEISRTVGAVPMRANYRTNIYGKLLTNSTDVNVDINPGFGGDSSVSLWDGSTIKEPAYDDATKTYTITNADELAYIAQLVNGTLDTDNVSRVAVEANSLKGYTVKLDKDINLNGKEWTPIGNGKHFMGTFDGNHKTISGLKVTKRGDARAALFGTVSGTVVFRNLTISGAEVRCPDFNGDFYGSALIGIAYGVVTIENVDVVDSYISGNNKVGALLAHDGVMNVFTVSGCDVSGTTFEATDAADCGLVGGLVGYFQTGGEHHITNCSVKGCTFNVVNSTNTGKRANGLLFGGIDSKANQKLYINDAVIENNTWNEKFYVDGVEVTEGKFISPYGGLIGGERNDKAEGELYINDELFVLPVATAEDLKKAIANKVSTIKVIGEIDLADVVLAGYNGTIVGVDDSACLNTRNFVPGPNEAYSLRCTNIAFQNIDFKLPTHSNYYTTGFVGTGDISFENCDFEGSTVLNSANAAATNWTFTECNFVSVESGAYASWVYAGTKATFNECTFAGVDRAAKIYGDGGEVEVEYNNCTFTSSTLNKNGVEIDSSLTTITAAFNNCSQSGMAGLYAVKGDKATVIVDGVAPQKNNEIWYVGDMKLEPTTPTAFNANIVSNVWDSTTGKGIITFDAPLTAIGDEAFKRITNTTPSNWATSITLPKGLKTIGNYAFYQCFSLTEIIIPDSVTSIGQYAFGSCQAATTVTIGSGVTSIASGAFYGCWELKEVVSKPTTPPAIADKWVFYDCDIRNVIVSAASVDAYKAANFWSSLNIVAE